ncbi:hypothetical protein OEW28_05555 [Defluviimonas sp. WL0002]|uniref:Uncharacterized protein n=1 Tax=Albidovulum marisflavi TaxID=2984159 RepID=A0ABT2ZAD8_9RHOB|nr:hypothetical protein [Defluviimonas sp. WL0002]MCV2868089.1 hypothetical protein [Defluviimonas sp. WL0002]
MELKADEHHFPAADLGALVDLHGPVRVILALAVALLRRMRRPPQVDADHLPAWLRRDVGLNWDPPRPRPWDLRL